MNTLAMNVRYSADSGFLEESLVRLLSTKPLMNSTKKTLLSICQFLSWGFYNVLPLSAGFGLLEAPLKERKLQTEMPLTKPHMNIYLASK